VAFLLLAVCRVFGQNNPTDHLPDYDEHKIHYGFLIGLHSSKFRIQYADIFNTPGYDSLHSIVPGNLGGFKLGFVLNFHLNPNVDFRLLPTVGFYENDLTYRFTDGTEERMLKDATYVELPLLFKFKSQRRGNYAMYVVTGIKPSIEARRRGDNVISQVGLEVVSGNLSLEIGAGFDMYMELFKFSPELRYSYGLRNLMQPGSTMNYNEPLKKVTMHNITMFVTFEGGPSTLKGVRRAGQQNSVNKKRSAPRK
jgi:hypothetical protein